MAQGDVTDSTPEGYVWQPYSCRYDIMSTPDRLACMRERNITRFLDYGDSLIVTARMPRTALWLTNNPTEWSTGRAALQRAEAANAEGCKGTQATYYGHDDTTGTHYCGANAFYQLPETKLLELIQSFSADVVLANWALVHRLWHHSFEQFDAFVKDFGKELDHMMKNAEAGKGKMPRFMFWLSAPALVSEREPHCVLERAQRYNAVLREVLQPRGWIEVDWMHMTEKWGLDIPDGMHHGPLPTRMLAYLLFHHICHGDGN